MRDNASLSVSVASQSSSYKRSFYSAITVWLARPTNRDLLLALLYCSPALLIFLIFTYFPLFRAIFLSLNVTNSAGAPVAFNGIDYYLRILNLDGSGRTDYLESIVTSFKFMLMVVPAGVTISVMLALLATVQVRGIQFFRTVFTSSIAISLASAGMIWALIYNPSTKATEWLVQLLNVDAPSLLGSNATAIPAVAVMSIWSGIGFNFIVALSGLQAIPKDLYESAAIDGGNRWQVLRFITLPLLSPTLLFLFVIGTISALQAFTQFHLLIPDSPNTVFIYETYRAFWYDNRYGLASAMSIIVFILLVSLTVIQYRTLDRRVHYQ